MSLSSDQSVLMLVIVSSGGQTNQIEQIDRFLSFPTDFIFVLSRLHRTDLYFTVVLLLISQKISANCL